MYDVFLDQVAQHLEEVLTSPVFRTSRRSCQFLRFIVEAQIAGRASQLKERVVGEEVFGRPPDYDTGQDSIVRVKACEVRRRLAQYYDLHPEAAIRIDLPAGAYSPQFHRGQPSATARPKSRAELARRRVTWVAVPAGIALLAGCLMAWRLYGASPFLSFWAPFVTGPDTLTLCVPAPDAYRIYGSGKAALIDALRPRAPGAPAPKFPKEAAAHSQIVAEPGEFLGIGDAHALTLLYAFAQSHGKIPQVRLAGSTSFTELRAGPNLLIGGFTNPWTLDLLKDARFVFASEEGVYGIRDRKTGKFVWRKPRNWEPRAADDCAVVTRIAHSKTGHPLLVAAGLDHSGTFEAGEFLTRAEVLEPVLRKLPADWEKRNLQIVFRAEVVRDNVGPPQVLATHVW